MGRHMCQKCNISVYISDGIHKPDRRIYILNVRYMDIRREIYTSDGGYTYWTGDIGYWTGDKDIGWRT